MMKNELPNERIDRIMGSLTNIQKAASPDFFYTRLQGKMQNQQEEKPFFMLRPAFITAALSIFLVANVFSLVEIKRTAKPGSATGFETAATIESFAKAYDMNTGSVYE